MRTDGLPRIDRRIDRRLYGFVYVSKEELAERGLPTRFKGGESLLYNGELFSVRAPTTNGILIWRHNR